MQHPATVRVVAPATADNPHGYVIINEDDLTDHHELFDDAPKPAPEPPPAPKAKPRG